MNCEEKGCDCEDIMLCDCECHDKLPVDEEQQLPRLTPVEINQCLIQGNDIQQAQKDLKIAELEFDLIQHKIRELQHLAKETVKKRALKEQELKAFRKLRTAKVKKLMQKYGVKGDTFAYDPETGIITEGVNE